jgi:uncharacterized protein YbjQ (UPF0145 family)
MRIPVFIGSQSMTDFDDTTKYKKVGSISSGMGRHITWFRRFGEEIRSYFGLKDILQSKMMDQVMEDAYDKFIKKAEEKYFNAVAIVNTEIDYEFDHKYIRVLLTGNVVVPRDQAKNNNTTKKSHNKHNENHRRNKSRKNRK